LPSAARKILYGVVTQLVMPRSTNGFLDEKRNQKIVRIAAFRNVLILQTKVIGICESCQTGSGYAVGVTW
jgi:hypothetical protein